jgi:hypothetical protein
MTKAGDAVWEAGVKTALGAKVQHAQVGIWIKALRLKLKAG